MIKISDSMIADWFGFKNVESFRGSTAKKRYREGVKKVLEHVGEEIKWQKK